PPSTLSPFSSPALYHHHHHCCCQTLLTPIPRRPLPEEVNVPAHRTTKVVWQLLLQKLPVAHENLGFLPQLVQWLRDVTRLSDSFRIVLTDEVCALEEPSGANPLISALLQTCFSNPVPSYAHIFL